MKPYSTTLPTDTTATSTDAAPTTDEMGRRMYEEMLAEKDTHKRAVARAQLIRFLTEGQRIATRAARESVARVR